MNSSRATHKSNKQSPRPKQLVRIQPVFRLIFGTKLYQLSLPKRATPPSGLLATDMWPGQSDFGQTIVNGKFEFSDKSIRKANTPWLTDGISVYWTADLSAFDWLRDIRAVGNEEARIRGRELVEGWINTHKHCDTIAWQPAVLGLRITNWLGHCDFLTSGSNGAFQQQFYLSLRQQTQHLRRIARFVAPGPAKIHALKGLIFSALAYGNFQQLQRSLVALRLEIDTQILGDGGNILRNPSLQLDYLRHIIDIRSALREGKSELPHWLQTTIDKLAPMLRFFRHGDGGLALFNDSWENQGWLIDVVLTRAEARGKPHDSAPHSGFERLTANRTLIIIDVGAPPPKAFDTVAHAGLLSFELCVGKERLIVNCGSHHGKNCEWMLAQRSTAAHSTVTVEDTNSVELNSRGGSKNQDQSVSVERKQANGDIWVETSHDGYQRLFGMRHSRRLYLASNGGNVRGEDTLTGGGNHKFVARFHLHPNVRASMVQEGNAVLLQLPSGTGWRFRASGGVLALQESVYLGTGSSVKRTQQIAITAATQEGYGQVKWALSQLTNG